MNKIKEIRYISLFRGIGGFEKGFEQAGGYKCDWSNDIDKYASIIYEKNFPESQGVTGDIRGIDEKTIPKHDLICAGFPCQAFSVAGKRKGFEDTRGTLFFEICRIAEYHRPELLLLENVKGLLNHDGGRTFATILYALEDLGYWWEYQVLNSKNYGVPQNRERVFIVGHLRTGSTIPIFPILKTSGITDGRIPSQQIASTLQSPGHAAGNYRGMNMIAVLTPDRPIKRQHGRRFKTPGEPMFTLTGQDKHGIMIIDPYNKNIKENGVAGTIKTNQGSPTSMGTAIVEPYIKNIPHGYNDGFEKPLPSLKANSGAQYNELLVNNAKIRRLTPTECERLQGFPDGWTEGISDTQRYKCLGNAVTVNVIEYLGGLLKASINSKSLRT